MRDSSRFETFLRYAFLCMVGYAVPVTALDVLLEKSPVTTGTIFQMAAVLLVFMGVYFLSCTPRPPRRREKPTFASPVPKPVRT